MNTVREILVLHHSHLDVGYTHSQPVAMELHREYIDLALDLLDDTAGWPDDGSRPKWTCEVTAPVLKWLADADSGQVKRFRAHAAAGRLSVGALRYNITPLNSRDQLVRQLAPAAELRERLGVPILAALQHDINGVPWPLADLLLDHGVDLFIMAVNRHLGGTVPPRPGVFRWRAPSGRELRVMNGNHYTMFDQILLTWERSLDAMKRGLDEYLGHLERIGYPHDFLYLTTTASPEMWDNSPPNPPVALLIRRWNEAGLQPPIRYVIPEELSDRIHRIPADQLPLLSGDWTDYWNFGCASTAVAVARSRAAKRALHAARVLAAADRPPAVRRAAEGALDRLDLFDEHTWSHWDTEARGDPARVQDALKSAGPVEAAELASYVLVDALEARAGNPPLSEGPPDQVLLFNPAPAPRRAFFEIPDAWRASGPRLRCERFQPPREAPGRVFGPVDLPGGGTLRLSLAGLAPAPDDPRLFHEDRRTPVVVRAFNNVRLETARTGDARIVSPRHELAYDPATGRILQLTDLELGWAVLPEGAGHSLFDFVRERPDALHDARREAYYERDLEREKFDLSCWKPWRAVRERATRCTGVGVTRTAGSITLDRTFEAPGCAALRVRLTLRADTPVIDVVVDLDRLSCPSPEGLYFATPLNLPEGWRGHFDTAGQVVELDAEQLPGASRGWFTVESFVSMHGGGRGMALLCPDAPMAMAGGFHFGPPPATLPRAANPLLLAWPMNNYWNTNFPLTQPGPARLRYGLLPHGDFDAGRIAREAALHAHPILAHPAFGARINQQTSPGTTP